MWGVSVESLLVSGCPQEIISPSEAELNYRIILERMPQERCVRARGAYTPLEEDNPCLLRRTGEEGDGRMGWEEKRSARKKGRDRRVSCPVSGKGRAEFEVAA